MCKPYEVIHQHRVCDAPGCKYVVTHWVQEVGYKGPVYCLRHGHLAEARC